MQEEPLRRPRVHSASARRSSAMLRWVGAHRVALGIAGAAIALAVVSGGTIALLGSVGSSIATVERFDGVPDAADARPQGTSKLPAVEVGSIPPSASDAPVVPMEPTDGAGTGGDADPAASRGNGNGHAHGRDRGDD